MHHVFEGERRLHLLAKLALKRQLHHVVSCAKKLHINYQVDGYAQMLVNLAVTVENKGNAVRAAMDSCISAERMSSGAAVEGPIQDWDPPLELLNIQTTAPQKITKQILQVPACVGLT